MCLLGRCEFLKPVCHSVRLKRVREKYEAELKEERAAVEKLLDQRKQQVEMEMELNRLRLVLRQKEHDIEDLVQVRLRHDARRSSSGTQLGTLCVNLSADQRAAGGGTTQPSRAHQAGLCQPAGHVGGGEPQAEGGDDGAAGEGPAGGGEGQPGEGGGACGSPAAVRRKPGSLPDCQQFKLLILPCF